MTRQPSRTTVVGTYQVEHEAELARAVLEANGVQAVVLRDNAGGMLPMLHILFQARLVVAADDAVLARQILDGSIGTLDEFAEPADDVDDDVDDVDDDADDGDDDDFRGPPSTGRRAE